MPLIEYVPKKFKAATLDVIAQANVIIADYKAQGFDLTLRQLYYQFVARDLLSNTQKSYDRLGSIVNDARLAGHIDWDAIEDRTRFLRSLPHWGSPTEIVGSCVQQYRRDKWEDQDCRPEVWIEKDALVGVIERVCNDLDVPFFSCRGYVSQSTMWRAAQRLSEHASDGSSPYIIHLGDHDPSGIDMSRDIAERMQLFGVSIDFKRIALNMDQIDEYDPPPNPAKLSDSRAKGYIAQYGASSWELDALDPSTLARLIRQTIEAVCDLDRWQASLDVERQERERIRELLPQL